MPFSKLSLFIPTLLLAGFVHATEPQKGPVIKNFGPAFAVPKASFNLQKNEHYKVSMDVSATGDAAGDLNRHIESAARFLNMQARHGIEPSNISIAIVVHGSASRDILKDDAYQARFGGPNPNSAMLAELQQAGVKLYLCGQTAAYRGISAEELNPSVELAVSAMTAHVRLQSEGFTLIPF